MNGQPQDGIRWQDVYAVEHIPASRSTRGKEALRIVGCHETSVVAQPDRVAKLLAGLREDKRFDDFLGFYIDVARLVPPPSKSEHGPGCLWFQLNDGNPLPLPVPKDVAILAYATKRLNV